MRTLERRLSREHVSIRLVFRRRRDRNPCPRATTEHTYSDARVCGRKPSLSGYRILGRGVLPLNPGSFLRIITGVKPTLSINPRRYYIFPLHILGLKCDYINVAGTNRGLSEQRDNGPTPTGALFEISASMTGTARALKRISAIMGPTTRHALHLPCTRRDASNAPPMTAEPGVASWGSARGGFGDNRQTYKGNYEGRQPSSGS